jgi:hypothetical protein
MAQSPIQEGLGASDRTVTWMVEVPAKSVCSDKGVGSYLNLLQCCAGTGTMADFLVPMQQNAELQKLCLPHNNLTDRFGTALAMVAEGAIN